MLWLPTSFSERRKSLKGEALFPSWSWAGWSGGINSPYHTEAISRVMWRDGSTGELFSSAEYRAPSSNWTKLEKSRSLNQAYQENSMPDLWFLNPTALDYQSRSRQFLKAESEVLHLVLQFRTLSAKFQIRGHHDCGSIANPAAGVHKLCSRGIYNTDGIKVGSVNILEQIACGECIHYVLKRKMGYGFYYISLYSR